MKYKSRLRERDDYMLLLRACKSFLLEKLSDRRLSWSDDAKLAFAFKRNGLAAIKAYEGVLQIPGGPTFKLSEAQIVTSRAGFTVEKARLRKVLNIDSCSLPEPTRPAATD
jgi:hypothetical protein